MKCPNCAEEMVKVYNMVQHLGPEGRMIRHPGGLKYYRCKKCGTKVEAEEKKEISEEDIK